MSSNNSSRTVDADCRRVVREIIAKYDWALPSEDELVEWVLDSLPAQDPPDDLEMVAYSVALHVACRQSDDPDRRERAYHELFRFLYRAAHNRWSELAVTACYRHEDIYLP